LGPNRKMGILSKLFGASDERKFFEQGMNYYSVGKYEECAKAFREAVRLKPNFAEAWALLGAAFGLLGKFQESIYASKEAIRLKPDLFQAYNSLGGHISFYT